VSLCLCGERTSRDSAIDTLRTALLAVLTLLAPYLPHVTEEIYLRGFATGDGASIHREHWPDASDFPPDAEAMEAGEAMLAVVEAVRRWKGERHLSVGAPLSGLIISCDAARASAIQSMEMDLRSISRAARIMIESGEGFAVSIEDE
jgi:valyl-tRNA synthetase